MYYHLLQFHLLPFITLSLLPFIMNHLNSNKWIFITIYYIRQLVDGAEYQRDELDGHLHLSHQLSVA